MRALISIGGTLERKAIKHDQSLHTLVCPSKSEWPASQEALQLDVPDTCDIDSALHSPA